MRRTQLLLAIGYSCILLTGCMNLLHYKSYKQAQAQLLDQIEAISVDDYTPSTWAQIDKSTSMVIVQMGDFVLDENKERFEEIVREHFIEDSKIKQSIILIFKNETDSEIRSALFSLQRDLRFKVADNTKDRVKLLIGYKGYRHFKSVLEPFLPKSPYSSPGYNSGQNWNWSGGGGHMPPSDGSSRWDGRAGP